MRKDEKLRLDLIASFGGACQQCGYNTSTRVLQFHHLDASAKKEWSGNRGGASLDEVQAYPERFLLLCANCHIEEHDLLDQAQYTIVQCAYCEKEFRTVPHKLKTDRGKYCSRRCQHDHRDTLARTQESIAARIWSHVQKTDTCWLWTGSLHYGHPQIKLKSPTGKGWTVARNVARILYEWEYGPIQVIGQRVRLRKLCDERCCVNPSHYTLSSSMEGNQK